MVSPKDTLLPKTKDNSWVYLSLHQDSYQPTKTMRMKLGGSRRFRPGTLPILWLLSVTLVVGGVSASEPVSAASSAAATPITPLSTTTDVAETTALDPPSGPCRPRHCVIVGGGPVGLATALTLSNAPHNYNVTVLEQSSAVQGYDPTRAYLYQVNPRGLAWFRDFGTATRRLLQWGTFASTTRYLRGGRPTMAMYTVPANPQTPLDWDHHHVVRSTATNRTTTNEEAQEEEDDDKEQPPSSTQEPVDTPEDEQEEEEEDTTPPTMTDEELETSAIWIPRHQMVQLLLETCADQHPDQPQRRRPPQHEEPEDYSNGKHDDDRCGSIQVYNDKQVVALRETTVSSSNDDNDTMQWLQVQCHDGSTYNATLLLAADGIDSAVRTILANRTAAAQASSSSWLHSRPRAFTVRKYPSPASGIKLKCLQFPPNFTLRDTDGSSIESVSTNAYVIRSINKGRRRMSLGLLPVKDPNQIRPVNLNTRYNHKVWSITDGPTMKAFFQTSFPRIVWDEIITNDAEWDRFATATGTTFPIPQYSPGTVLSSPHHPQDVGIVLVGDACHAFPPDIGQGINAGLSDVLVLDRCLQGQDIRTGQPLTSTEPTTLVGALQRYEQNRQPEHKALVRLSQCGAPYQYRQSWYTDRIGSALWFANVALRKILHSAGVWGIHPAAIVQCFESQKTPPALTYRQVMEQADRTTRILQTVAGLAIGLVGWGVCGGGGSMSSIVSSLSVSRWCLGRRNDKKNDDTVTNDS